MRNAHEFTSSSPKKLKPIEPEASYTEASHDPGRCRSIIYPNISQQTRNFSELRRKLRGVPSAWSLQQPGGRVSDDRVGANRVAEDGADRVGANRVAEDGADRVGANRVAEDGADRVGANRVAADGADRVGANRVAADGADHVGANRVAADGADRVGANRVASDGADHVGGSRIASTSTRGRIGGIGSDAVASLR